MRFVVAIVVVVVVSLGGCLVGEVTGIPCGDDSQCPSDHFCDIPNDTCVAGVDGQGAADLTVRGVRDRSGDVVSAPRVARDVKSVLQLVIENAGGDADDVSLEMVRLVCMNLEFDPTTVPTHLEAGASVEVEFTVLPDGCGTPSIQDWFLFYSGRAKRGTFNILPDRVPRPDE